ncbi:hypothetical protein BC830DRAFT_1163166 [Chytriomyces sp. MP71]|nr:hypothetical protein BC830DRAFT_1163166 [Chytriomyces sp. MP71]
MSGGSGSGGNTSDFEQMLRGSEENGLSRRMGVPANAMDVDSDLSDIDEELNENARFNIGSAYSGSAGPAGSTGPGSGPQGKGMGLGMMMGGPGVGPSPNGPNAQLAMTGTGAGRMNNPQMGFARGVQGQMGPGGLGPYGGSHPQTLNPQQQQQQQQQQQFVGPSRVGSLNNPFMSQPPTQPLPAPPSQQLHQQPLPQQQQQQPQPQPQPPVKKGLFGFGKKSQQISPATQPGLIPSAQQSTRTLIQEPQVLDVNRQKRLSSDQRRISMEHKRGSLEIKLHDGMIVVDEEERKLLQRKYGNGGQSNIPTSPTNNSNNQNNNNVITHSQVHNHYQPPPRAMTSPPGAPSMVMQQGQQPNPNIFDPRMRPPMSSSPYGGQLPMQQQQGPYNPNLRNQQSPMGGGPIPGGFQGPPRTGSLNSPPLFSQQYQRPPQPMMKNMPPHLQQQQQQQQRLSYMGNNIQGAVTPANSAGPPGTQPYRPLPVVPPQPLQLPTFRSSPLFDPLQPTPAGNEPQQTSSQNVQQQQQPQKQQMPGSTRLPEANNMTPSIPEDGPLPGARPSQMDTTTPADDDEEYYDDDDESVGSFISFDEATEDNTEYNAIVDYDLLDHIMGGSTDYDAPLQRVGHGRRVVFTPLVKASTLVRVLPDGQVLTPGADPDGDTEFETEGTEDEGDEDEDEYGDNEESEDDDRPESPMVEVVSMLPLRLPDQDVPPEIAPRGVSLKMAEAVAGVSGGGEGGVEGVPNSVVAAGRDSEAAPSPQPPLDPEHDAPDAAGIAAGGERKKVRHVQIQTRGATVKHQTTLTEIFGLEEELDMGFTAEDIREAIAAGGVDANAIPGAVDPAAVSELEAEVGFLREQAAALQTAMAQMQAEAAARQAEAEEKQAKFDKLSGQAMRKIKELVAERKVMEVEIESLRNQVKGLDELVQKWTVEAE